MTHLNEYAKRSHETAKAHGFWETERNFGEMIALMHSELSEALEEHRAGRPAVWEQHAKDCDVTQHVGEGLVQCTCTPKPEGTAVELVDCIVRIVDMVDSLLEGTGLTVEDVMDIKMDYNDTRPYKHDRQY